MSAKKPKNKRESAVGRMARVFDAAMKDADHARKHSSDPGFRKDVQRDRRGTLSSFRTVQHALEDRAKVEKAKEKKSSR